MMLECMCTTALTFAAEMASLAVHADATSFMLAPPVAPRLAHVVDVASSAVTEAAEVAVRLTEGFPKR